MERARSWMWISRLLGFAALLLFVALTFTPLPNLLARSLATGPGIAPADAIVVLSGGTPWPTGALDSVSLRRAVNGIVLYQSGLAPLLVFSGSHGEGPRSETTLRADLARRCGVSGNAILTDSWASSTRDEGRRMQSLLRPHGVRRILLVTDAQHMARAKRLFEREGFEVLAAPANDLPDTARAPEARLLLVRRTLQEIAALIYYHVAGYL